MRLLPGGLVAILGASPSEASDMDVALHQDILSAQNTPASRARPLPLRRWLAYTTAVIVVVGLCHAALRYAIAHAGLKFGAVSETVAPLYAYVRPHLKGWLFVPLAWLALYAVLLRRSGFLSRWPVRRFVPALYGCSLMTAATVAILDGGPERVAAPYTRLDLEYAGAVPLVGDPVRFVARFPEIAHTLPMHAQNHPPVAVLLLWAVARLTGGGPERLAWFTVAVAAGTAPLAYAAARAAACGQELTARLAAVLFTVLPSAVLFSATSMDGVFAVFLGGAFAPAILCRSQGARAAAAAGFSAGLGLLMTYSAVWVGLWFALYVLLERKRFDWPAVRLLLSFAVAFLTPTMLLATVGYRPVDTFLACLSAHHRIMAGTAHDEPLRWAGLALGNLSAFAIGCGLAVAGCWLWGLAERTGHQRPLWLATAGTILIAAAAPVYTLEVERIWLFLLVPVVACVAELLARLPGEHSQYLWRTMVWLSVAQTLTMEILLETYW